MTQKRRKMTREEKTKRNIKRDRRRQENLKHAEAMAEFQRDAAVVERARKAGIELAKPGDMIGLDLNDPLRP